MYRIYHRLILEKNFEWLCSFRRVNETIIRKWWRINEIKIVESTTSFKQCWKLEGRIKLKGRRNLFKIR